MLIAFIAIILLYRKSYENGIVDNLMKKIIKNEDAPFYFEKLFAGISFLDLLEKKPLISRIEIKPDRRHGADRRIEDLTKFYKDGTIEVIQIKHTLNSANKWGFGDLWIANPSKSSISKRKEGTNIYKFLKSWRLHKKNGKHIRLIVASNKTPTVTLGAFLDDVKKLRSKKLFWRNFQKKYPSEIKSIESNCSKQPFVNNRELRDFIATLQFQNLPDIGALSKELTTKLKKQGVLDDTRINAFINRVNKLFVSNLIEILPEKITELIDRLKTGLLQEIIAPPNYVGRSDLEAEILKTIETKKKDGGFVLLFAPSGSGKTVLLSKMADRNQDFLPYFCRIRPFEVIKGRVGYSNNNRLKSSWFKADIIQRCYEFGLIPMSVGISDDEGFIDKTFDEALKKLSEKALQRPDKKIVIIVDALDQIETDKFKDRSVLDAIPPISYPGVVFLLSTWGEKYLPQSIKNLPKNQKKKVGINLFFTEKEIQDYFNHAGKNLSRDHIAVIKKKTDGLAISLFYLNKKLHGHNNFDDIIYKSPRYSDVFDWYKPIWGSLKNKEKDCLGYLCFHFAPVKRDDLRKIVPGIRIAHFNSLIKTIDHFLDSNYGALEPYHDSFRRFVVAKLSAEKKAYHQKIAKYYSKNTHLPYARKYITKHLEIVRLAQPSVKSVFNRLHRNQFYKKILRSKIDNQTKVEIGKSFVNYFYKTNNIEQLVKYAIIASNIYPTVRSDDIYEKAHIATDKLRRELEEELFLPKGDKPWLQQEWVFKRLAIGNILSQKKDKNCLILANRFIDDSLFRISLNIELLWGKDDNTQREFWSNAENFALALVNINRYKRALIFFKKEIGFKKPKAILEGFRGNYLAKVHLQNLKIDLKETLETLAKSRKIERLLTYLIISKEYLEIPNEKDFKNLLRDERLEKYLYDDENRSQRLDLAEALLIHNIKGNKSRILKILDKVEAEIPYHNHGYSYWGSRRNARKIFLRWIALKSIIDKNFKLKEFYLNSLKNKFPKSDISEYKNEEFIEILLIEQNLAKNRLLLYANKIDWKIFWKSIQNALKLYKLKLDQIKSQGGSYSSETQKNLYPYSQDLHSLVRDNLITIKFLFPNKLLVVLKKIEDILGKEHLDDRVELLEILIGLSTIKTPSLKEKVRNYINRALELRQKEKLDNLNKSENLKNLAVLAADKGFSKMAENIFDRSLHYSRGLWNKGDLRISNLIDSLRTQKQEQFPSILKQIDRVSNIIEGAWYWRLEFLESATYADYGIALDYLYPFVIKGKVNQNEALSKIISTYVKRYPYGNIGEILPLLKLMDLKEENSSEYFEHISNSYSVVIKWSILNKDFITAKRLAQQYIAILKTDTEPSYRINLFKKLIGILYDSVFNKIRSEINSYLKQIEQEGYEVPERNNSEFKITYEGLNIKRLKTLARRGNLKALQKNIDKYVQTKGYFTDRLITELVPSLSDDNLQKIRKWGLKNNINIDSPELFGAVMRKAAIMNNRKILSRTRTEIVRYINSSDREYNLIEIIKELDKIDFPNKKAFIKKLLLLTICKLTGSGDYLPQLFVYSSDSIDCYFPQLKEYSFESWKSIVAKSTRLSLSK